MSDRYREPMFEERFERASFLDSVPLWVLVAALIASLVMFLAVAACSCLTVHP